MNDRLKIYLDTTVISHLRALDAPEKMVVSLYLWQTFKSNPYDVFISEIAIDEINKCPEPKRSFMFSKLNEIKVTILEIDDEVNSLALEFINLNILCEDDISDCKHIASAILSKCNTILSWNFKHMVNDKTRHGVKIISTNNHYNDITILSPSIFIISLGDNHEK